MDTIKKRMCLGLPPEDMSLVPQVAQRGTTEGLKLMFELGVDPQVPGWSRMSALSHAAWMGRAEATNFLLKYEDSFNVGDSLH